MSHESLNSASKNSLEALFEKGGREFPSDPADRRILKRLFTARQGIARNGSSGFKGDALDGVLPGDTKEARMKVAKRLSSQIRFVVDCTPSRSQALRINPFHALGVVSAKDRQDFDRAARTY